jgi:hypothetical protein
LEFDGCADQSQKSCGSLAGFQPEWNRISVMCIFTNTLEHSIIIHHWSKHGRGAKTKRMTMAGGGKRRRSDGGGGL